MSITLSKKKKTGISLVTSYTLNQDIFMDEPALYIIPGSGFLYKSAFHRLIIVSDLKIVFTKYIAHGSDAGIDIADKLVEILNDSSGNTGWFSILPTDVSSLSFTTNNEYIGYTHNEISNFFSNRGFDCDLAVIKNTVSNS